MKLFQRFSEFNSDEKPFVLVYMCCRSLYIVFHCILKSTDCFPYFPSGTQCGAIFYCIHGSIYVNEVETSIPNRRCNIKEGVISFLCLYTHFPGQLDVNDGDQFTAVKGKGTSQALHPRYAKAKRIRWYKLNTGLIPGLRPANKRRRYKVTPSLIGWAKT